MANRLVALSSAAVLTVYSAGYLRTRAAAQRLEAAADRPRVVIPSAPVAPVGPPSAASVQPPSTPAAPPASTAIAATPTPTPKKKPNPSRAAATDVTATAKPSSPTPARSKPAASPSAPPATPAPAAAPPATTTAPAAAAAATTAAEAEPPATPAPPPTPQWKDGTYTGWGSSRHGDIQAAVVIENGKIVSATIAQCWTRYSCSWIAHLQGQVVARQSPEVDYVSGATQSTNAFYYAVVEALSKAK
jgi:uncharacterized protein with FMN-binding domain